MKRKAVHYRAIGEDRYGVVEAGKLVEVHIERWHDAHRPRAGETWTGRVGAIDGGMGAAFIDLGSGESGFLRFSAAPGLPKVAEGQLLDVLVKREGEPAKGPILGYVGKPTYSAPGVVEEVGTRAGLDARFPGIEWSEGDVPALSELVLTELAIPGGGTVAIEPTRALVAVDVDKGAQVLGLKAGQAAALLVARQLRLRGLAGLICIDFPNLRQARARKQLEASVAQAFEFDPDKPKIAPLSRFGVVEMTRVRRRRSLDRLLADTPLETASLEALDRLLREGRAQAGARLTLSVTPDICAWLEATDLDWRGQLTERLGARWVLAQGERVSVSADR